MTETEHTTIRVTKAAHQQASERKPDHMTWSEWITDERRGYPDADAVAAALAERVDCLRLDDADTAEPSMDDLEDHFDDAYDASACPDCGYELTEALGEANPVCPACGWGRE
jgi:rubrerythrin